MVNEKIHKTIAYFLLVLLFLSLILTLASFYSCNVTVIGGCYSRYLTVDEIEPNLDCLEFEENTCVGCLTVLNKCDKEVVLVGVANYFDSGAHVKEMYFNETIRNQPGFKENFLTLSIPPQSSRKIESVLDLVLQNQSAFSDGDDVEWNITAIYDGQNYTIHGGLTSHDNDGFDLCYLLNIFGVFSLVLLITTKTFADLG